jgi:subtilisin family serine protease
VNPNVQLVPLKVVDRDGMGTSYDLIDAINYAKDNGIKLLNISLAGYGDPSTSPICSAISAAKTA